MALSTLRIGGFSRLSKGLSGVLVVVYLLTLIFPWTLNYLTLIPARTIPFAWNIITAGYTEQSVFGLILSIFGLLLSGKLLEPQWTAREFLKFTVFVNTATLFGVYVTAVASYYITRKEKFIYMRLSGFHGVLSGFLVGVKQAVPDYEIEVLGRFNLRAEWLPSLLVMVSIVASIFTLEAMRYLPFVLFGTYGSWLYLRYLQRKPGNNFTGNPPDEFAFSTFFPHFMRPMIEVAILAIHKLLCKSYYRRRDIYSSDSLSEANVDAAEASRWRERRLRALDERSQEPRGDDTQKDDASNVV